MKSSRFSLTVSGSFRVLVWSYALFILLVLGGGPGGRLAAQTVSTTGDVNPNTAVSPVWTVGGALYVGSSGEGELRIEDGGEVSNSVGIMGEFAGAKGSVTVTGIGSKWTNTSELFVGYAGEGELLIESGGEVSNSTGYVGLNTGAKGSVTVSGSGSTWTNTSDLYVGRSGEGALSIGNGGRVSVAGSIVFGSAIISGAGTLNLETGGILEVGGINGLQKGLGAAAFNLSGGTLRVIGSDLTTSLNAALTNSSIIDTNGLNATLSGVLSGAGGLEKTGAGALTLTRANTYGGGTALTEGTLRIGNNSALGTGALTIEAGTTLATNGSARTITNNLVVNGDFSIFPEGTIVGINAFSLNGAIDLTGGTRTITNPSDFAAGQFGQVNFGGVISNGALRLVGLPGNAAAFFRMNGAQSNTYTGDTIIGEGISLQLAKTGGAIAIAGNVEILNDGVAAVNLSEQIADTASVTIRGIGRLQLGAGAAVTETIGSLFGDGLVTLDDTGVGSTLRVGAGEFSGVINEGVAGGVSVEKTGAGTLILSGDNTYLGDTVISAGTLQVGSGGTSGALGAGNVTNNGALIFNRSNAATVANAISGTGDVTKQGAGVLTFTGANTYLGTTTISAGGLRIGDGGTSGSLGAGDVVNNGSLIFDRSDTVVVTNLISGTGSVLQQGTGTTTLSGVNTYGGGTAITAGTLRLGVSGALGTGGLLIDGGTLDLNDFEQTVTSLSGLGGSIDFSGSPYSSRLVVDQDVDTTFFGDFNNMIHFEKHGSGKLTLNGTLTSSWGYFIIGEGTLVLNGANDMTSGWGTHEIYLRDAVLEVGNDLALGESSLYVKSPNSRLQSNRSVTLDNRIVLDRDLDADLTIGGAFALTLNGVISESGAIPTGGQIIKTGTSVLTLGGANTYSGGTRLDAGTLLVGHNSALGTGALAIAGGTMFGNDGTARTIANDLVVNGDFSLSATASTAGAAALALTGDIDLGGATRTLTHRFDAGAGEAGLVDFGGVIGNGALTLTTAPGAQAFFIMSGSQSNTYTGDTVVGEGVSLELARNAQTSIAGDLFINDGAVVRTAWSRQIAETASVTITGTGRLEIGTTDARFESIDALFGDGEIALFSDVSSGGGLDVRSGVFSGKITGGAPDEFSVVKEGAGLLVLSGENTFVGDTLVNGGTLQLGDGGTTGSLAGDIELRNGSSLVFDRSNAFTAANVISGDGTLTKNGEGVLTLTGTNTYTGATLINAGGLRVNGALASDTVTVASGAFLGGAGTISGDVVVQSGGILAPGNSPGLLTVGSLMLNAGSFTQMELNGTATAGVDYDQIRVTGEATLGGTLELILGGGYIPENGDSFVLIDADSITADSDFDVVNGLGNALLFTATITDDYTLAITVVQTDFEAFALTPNQRAVARNLDSDWTNPAMQPVIDALNALPGTSLPGAFDLIAPEEYAALPRFVQSNTRAMWSGLRQRFAEIRGGSTGWSIANLNVTGRNGRLDLNNSVLLAAVGDTADAIGMRALAAQTQAEQAPVDERRGFFVSGTGTFGDNEDDGNAAGYEFAAGGIVIGTDLRLTPDAAVGVMAGYGHTETDYQGTSSNIDAETARIGLYGTWTGLNQSWLNATAGGAYHWYESKREGLGGTASGTTGGAELNAMIEAGRDFDVGRWVLTPSAGADYLWLRTNGFTETGSLAPLTLSDEMGESLRSELALTAAYRIRSGNTAWSPYVRAGWQHEFLDTQAAVQSRLASGAGGVFSVSGSRVSRDSALLGAGVQARLSAALEAGLSYAGELNTDYQTHSVNLHLRLRF